VAGDTPEAEQPTGGSRCRVENCSRSRNCSTPGGLREASGKPGKGPDQHPALSLFAWGTNQLPGHVDRALAWYRELPGQQATVPVPFRKMS